MFTTCCRVMPERILAARPADRKSPERDAENAAQLSPPGITAERRQHARVVLSHARFSIGNRPGSSGPTRESAGSRAERSAEDGPIYPEPLGSSSVVRDTSDMS